VFCVKHGNNHPSITQNTAITPNKLLLCSYNRNLPLNNNNVLYEAKCFLPLQRPCQL
jgi:hypothetical protein